MSGDFDHLMRIFNARFRDYETRLEQHDRRLNNLVIEGRVTKLHAKDGLAEVDAGDLGSMPVPWLQRAGTRRDWDPPALGERIVLLSPSGDPGQGLILPGGYSTKYPQNSQTAGTHRSTYGRDRGDGDDQQQAKAPAGGAGGGGGSQGSDGQQDDDPKDEKSYHERRKGWYYEQVTDNFSMGLDKDGKKAHLRVGENFSVVLDVEKKTATMAYDDKIRCHVDGDKGFASVRNDKNRATAGKDYAKIRSDGAFLAVKDGKVIVSSMPVVGEEPEPEN